MTRLETLYNVTNGLKALGRSIDDDLLNELKSEERKYMYALLCVISMIC